MIHLTGLIVSYNETLWCWYVFLYFFFELGAVSREVGGGGLEKWGNFINLLGLFVQQGQGVVRLAVIGLEGDGIAKLLLGFSRAI